MTKQTRDLMLTLADWKLLQALDMQAEADRAAVFMKEKANKAVELWLDRKLELELEDEDEC